VAVEVVRLEEPVPATSRGLWRARTTSDSAVVKVVALGGKHHPRWPAAADEEHPYYWRREALAYESGLLERLVGLRTPRCRGVFERPDGSVAIWLEDVPEAPPWTPDALGLVAERLGRAHAACSADPPTEPWFSRGWLRAYLGLRQIDDPEPEAVLARLDELPQTLCHFDLHPANVLGADRSVVIDWAYCGLGAIGLDPGVLVVDGIADESLAPEVADAAADEVWRGYLSGLRAGGWTGREEDARWAYLRGTALRLSWMPRGVKPAWDATRALLDRWLEQARELA